jgi:CheY-like chemotaxis protein
MNEQLPLILSVADLAYSGGEAFELLGLCLERAGFKADLRGVALTDVVETASHLQPALILIGHRPLLDDEPMRERWEAAGSPMGGDIIKSLKSDADTKDIPVLLIEGLVRIEEVATESGADAYVRVPCGSQEITKAIKELVKTIPNGG